MWQHNIGKTWLPKLISCLLRAGPVTSAHLGAVWAAMAPPSVWSPLFLGCASPAPFIRSGASGKNLPCHAAPMPAWTLVVPLLRRLEDRAQMTSSSGAL